MIERILFIFGAVSEIALAQTSNKNKQVIKKMRKSAPSKFAPYVASTKKLKPVIEGDSFYWEKKAKKQKSSLSLKNTYFLSSR